MKRVNNPFEATEKCLSDSIKYIAHIEYDPTKNKENTYMENKAKFCKSLREHGYETYTVGNFVHAKRNGESNTFYFASHNQHNKNYLLPMPLENRVQYFAFYDSVNDCAYFVGYGKVREYANTISKAVVFGSYGKPRLFIPDKWVKEQRINTFNL